MIYNINEILRSEKGKYDLTLFNRKHVDWLEKQIFDKGGKPYIKCLGSDKDRPIKPEEIVRQLWIKKILDEYHYPKERIGVEISIWKGSGIHDKAADIIIYHKDRDMFT